MSEANASHVLAEPSYRTITADQWQALLAAKLGGMLDAMDFLLYVMAIGQLQKYFGFDSARPRSRRPARLVVAAHIEHNGSMTVI